MVYSYNVALSRHPAPPETTLSLSESLDTSKINTLSERIWNFRQFPYRVGHRLKDHHNAQNGVLAHPAIRSPFELRNSLIHACPESASQVLFAESSFSDRIGFASGQRKNRTAFLASGENAARLRCLHVAGRFLWSGLHV
jgi:hypothetical protein